MVFTNTATHNNLVLSLGSFKILFRFLIEKDTDPEIAKFDQ
jgi:hypothetical protein